MTTQKLVVLGVNATVDSLEDAQSVLGTAAFKAIVDWGKLEIKTERAKEGMGRMLFNAGMPSMVFRSPKNDEKVANTIYVVHGEEHTHKQLFDAAKLAVLAARSKADQVLWFTPTKSMAKSKRAEKRSLQQNIGSQTTKVGDSIKRFEDAAKLEKLQTAEDALAKQEGREAETITLSTPKHNKSVAVKTAEHLNNAKKLVQGDSEPNYDVFEVVRGIDAALKALHSAIPHTPDDESE